MLGSRQRCVSPCGSYVPGFWHCLSHYCSEGTGRNAHHTTTTAFMLDGRQITALVLDDGARLAHQPGLAGGARLADIGVNAKDRTHRGLLYINNAAAPNRQRGGILEKPEVRT
jgi:hypothetical protein